MMKRTALATLVRTAVTALVVGLTVVGAASANFSGAGAGSGSATAGALTAPAINSATPGAGTVQLTWSSVAPPAGSGPVTYYVSRNGGAAAGNCPTAANPSSATSCTDSGLTKGSYNYTVTAVWHSWTATSAPDNGITVASGAVSQLVFTTQPDGSPTGGKAFPAQPVVTAEDAGGNTVTTYTGTVGLTIKSGTGATGASLSGCTGTLTNGVTTFTGCTIDKAGSGYQLTATDGTLNTTSNPFTIAVGAASQLVFSTQPDGSATGGVTFPNQPVVAAEDAGGNVVTGYAGTVLLSIKSGTGTSGASLSGCSGNLTSGITTFTGCKIDKSGNAYQLTATDGTLNATSNAFNIAVGPASQLLFTTQPDGSATGGIAFPNQPVVTAEDAGGNTVPGDSGTITLAIKSGTGTAGASLSGCSRTLTNGVATFTGCTINKAGSGYQLTATDGTLNTTSNTFNITVGAASQLVFTTQPDGSPTAGAALPTQPKLTVEDAGGNIVTTDSSTVTLSITSGTPTQGGPGSLSGCSQTETAGVISFSGCTINTAGNGYRLHGADGSLTAVDSAAFNVSTTAPNVAITYPVTGTTYGSGWTGSITGTASATGGLSVTGTAVSIEDTTTGKWWDGTGFNGGTASYQAASGTSSWSYSFTAGNLTPGHSYAVTAQATDSLNDVGTSSTVAFTYGAVSVSMIGQSAAKSATVTNVQTTSGATDLIVIYCWGGSSCGSTGSTPTVTGPFSSVSTATIQSIVFSGNTKSCVEVVQAVGNGQTGPVSVTFSGGSADSVGFIDVVQLSAGATVKATGVNPSTQTQSTTPLATLPTTGSAELAIVGLDGNQGNDTIAPPTGVSALAPATGSSNPESNSTIGNAGGNLGVYFTQTAQSQLNFTLSPTAVDWGTVALGIG
jgi:hypothetical protein